MFFCKTKNKYSEGLLSQYLVKKIEGDKNNNKKYKKDKIR